jgi:hypothetical protein
MKQVRRDGGKSRRKISSQISFAPPGLDLFLGRKPAVETAGYFLTPLRG